MLSNSTKRPLARLHPYLGWTNRIMCILNKRRKIVVVSIETIADHTTWRRRRASLWEWQKCVTWQPDYQKLSRVLKGQYHHFDEIWHCIGPTFLVRELKTDPRSSTPLSRYRRSKYERCTTLWIVLHYLHCLNVCAVLNWPPVIKLLPWSFHQIL